MREAAKARAGKGEAIGTVLGATALLNPATAPFAPATMAAGRLVGGYAERVASGGSAKPTSSDVMGTAMAVAALPADQKKWDKLGELTKMFKTG